MNLWKGVDQASDDLFQEGEFVVFKPKEGFDTIRLIIF